MKSLTSQKGRKGRLKSPWNNGPMVSKPKNWIRYYDIKRRQNECDDEREGGPDRSGE